MSLGRSNIGGWHSRPDFLNRSEPAVAALTQWITWAVRKMIEAVTAPGDPYGEPLRVWPESGLLVIFPSWLFHWAHPYIGKTPRIAVSFNATLERRLAEQEH